jgi:colicin import membrane protein
MLAGSPGLPTADIVDGLCNCRTMPKTLKTFTTSAGFFDLAVAAPSMKAALENWGSTNNLFHQGFAKMSDDPTIIEATMAKPGVVLRRPVGTSTPFTEHANLPRNFASIVGGPTKHRSSTPNRLAPPIDSQTARDAAQYEREQKQREREARREEATQEKERKQRERAIAAAEAALEAASSAHKKKVADLEKVRAVIDNKLGLENERRAEEKDGLEGALRRARS